MEDLEIKHCCMSDNMYQICCLIKVPPQYFAIREADF